MGIGSVISAAIRRTEGYAYSMFDLVIALDITTIPELSQILHLKEM